MTCKILRITGRCCSLTPFVTHLLFLQTPVIYLAYIPTLLVLTYLDFRYIFFPVSGFQHTPMNFDNFSTFFQVTFQRTVYSRYFFDRLISSIHCA